MGSDTAFINQQLPAARVASAQLGIPVSVVLAQWINETSAGSSPAFVQGNNYAGVSYLDKQEAAVGATLTPGLAPILSYPTQAAGLAGYVNRWLEPTYAPTRALWSKSSDPIEIAQTIEASPWAQGHYSGHALEDLITQNNLTAYDNPATGGGGVSAAEWLAQLQATYGTAPGTGSAGTSAGQKATLDSASDPFPGGSWDPLNWGFEAANGIAKSVGAIVLTGAFLVAGLVLVVTGFWRAAGPRVQQATSTVAKAAPAAALAV